jgi:hypothetical protein
VRCMAAAPSHNPTAVTKKVYFDISIGGQPEGEVPAGTSAFQGHAAAERCRADRDSRSRARGIHTRSYNKRRQPSRQLL